MKPEHKANLLELASILDKGAATAKEAAAYIRNYVAEETLP